MKETIRTIGTELLHLFYPNLCQLCNQPLVEGEKQLCIGCLCDLPRTGGFSTPEKNPILQMLAFRPEVIAASAFLYYEKGAKAQTLIHTFKYRSNRKMAFILGRQAAVELYPAEPLLASADLLLPIPLHRWRQWERGYNQAEWLARGVQSVFGTPITSTVLKRLRVTGTQTSRSVYERRMNMEKAFTLLKPEHLTGKHVLLIDDVMTTGATLSACVEALCQVPDIKISILVLAIV